MKHFGGEFRRTQIGTVIGKRGREPKESKGRKPKESVRARKRGAGEMDSNPMDASEEIVFSPTGDPEGRRNGGGRLSYTFRTETDLVMKQ